MSKTLVLYSGGLDSTTVLAGELAAGNEVLALSFDYGQSNIKELEVCQRLSQLWGFPHKIIELPLEHKDARAEIPGRNTIFLAKAIEQALINKCDAIAYGAEPDATYVDSSPEYIKAMGEVCRLHGIKLLAPLRNMEGKLEVLQTALELGVPLDLVHSSRTNLMNGADSASGRFLMTLRKAFPFINPTIMLEKLRDNFSHSADNPYYIGDTETGSFKFFPALFLLAGEKDIQPVGVTVYTTGNWGKSLEYVNENICRRFTSLNVRDVGREYSLLSKNRYNTNAVLATWGVKQALSRLPRPQYLKFPLTMKVVQGHLKNTVEDLGYTVHATDGMSLITER